MSALPSDIISSILIAIEQPTDVLAASQVCSRWRAVYENPQYGVCHHHCLKFKYWTDSQQPDSMGDWNISFACRLKRDAYCRALLEKVVNGRTGTMRNIEELVKMWPEAKEVITELWRNVQPEHLSEEYYFRVIYQKLSRVEAKALVYKTRAEEGAASYEDALVVFSLFWEANGGDPTLDKVEMVKTRLNELAQLALGILDSSNDKSLPLAVQTICGVMTTAGIVAAHDIDYYNVENSFIHLALEGRPSLPITMAVIFSGIAWRCGIAAAPINYPGHVFVAVSSSPTFATSDTLFVDVFNTGTVLSHEQLHHPLEGFGTVGTAETRPASPESMMFRVARNIINAFNRRPASGLELPWFAALTVLTILEPNLNLGDRVCDFIRSHPSLCDTDLDTIEFLCRSRQIDGYEMEDHMEFCRLTRRHDIVGPPQKRRWEDYAAVKHNIGQVFKHRLFRYVGVVYGYDEKCRQSQIWKDTMQVSALPRGETQPFYHVLADDGSARYVGEDNICILQEIPAEEIQTLCKLREIGRYFSRFDKMSATFIATARVTAEYPDL